MVTLPEVRALLERYGLPGATVDSELSRVWLDDIRAVRLYTHTTPEGLALQLAQTRVAVARRHDETAAVLGLPSGDEARAMRVELVRLGGGVVQLDPTGEIERARAERDAAWALAEQRYAEIGRLRCQVDELRRLVPARREAVEVERG